MKPIVCLETTWYPNSNISVQPFLETLSVLEGVRYVRYPCNSIADLKHYICRDYRHEPGILYIAMHGHRGRLSFTDRTKESVTLKELAEMMEKRFKGWHVHFASCETINVSNETFQAFKKSTGAKIVSGYTKQVDWIVSYSMDMLLLNAAQRYSRSSYLVKFMYKVNPEMMSLTGMYIE